MRQKFFFFILLFGLFKTDSFSQLDSWEKIFLAERNDDYLNFTINKNVLYICGEFGVKKSTNADSVWTSFSNTAKYSAFKSICVTPSKYVFVVPNYKNSILRTSNEGVSWDTLFKDYRFSTISTDYSGCIWLARDDGTLFSSTDNGINWTKFDRLSGSYIFWINYNRNNDLFVSRYDGIHYKNKNDTAWTKITDKYVISFAAKGNDTLIISYENGGTYLSTNKGSSWKYLQKAHAFNSVAFDFAGNIWGGIDASSYYNYIGVYKSTDLGETWKYTGGGVMGANKMICSGDILCIADRFGVCRYNKNITPYLGNNYFPLNKNNKWMNYKYPQDYSQYSEARIDTLLITKDTIISGAKYYFVSGICGLTKQEYWYRFDENARILFVRYNDTDRVLLNYNLLNYEKFERFNINTGKYYVTRCVRGTKNIFDSTRNYIGFNDTYTNGSAGRDYYELYYERIGFGYWDNSVDPSGGPESNSNERIICAVINDGDSIKTYRKTYAPELSFSPATVKRPYLLTLNVKADHYYSYYNPLNLPGSINFIDSVFLTGYYKKNNSLSEIKKYPFSYKDSVVNFTISQQLDSVLINNGYDFYYRITAKDICFIPYYTSLPDTGYYKLKIDSATRIINNDDKNVPLSFYLSQNFPNPFNPSTTVKYSLPEESRVLLVVYNSLGQKIKELVNSVKPAGNYEASFDAGNLSSGVYFYQLRANGFSQTRKLIIQK